MTAPNFFLDPASTGDDYLFLAPGRAGSTVAPLIDGVETFRAMETAIAGATRSVHLSAWIFNPTNRMPLAAKRSVSATLTRRGVKRGIADWSDLLTAVASLGVEVRVLISDFDPILQNALHAMSWSSYRTLLAAARAHAKGHLQVMCAIHEAVRSTGVQSVMQGILTGKVLPKLTDAGFRNMPRLWAFVQRDPRTGRFVQAPSPSWVARPACHHQKICIVDGSTGFCGGLDIQFGRFDTRAHEDTLWHDTHCRVDDQLAADLDRNFAGRWNHDMAAFNAFIASVATGTPSLTADAVTAMTVPASTPAAGSGPATGQLVRTVSVNWIFPDPNDKRHDVADMYQRAIGLANQFIYIENQYLRDSRIGGWIKSRAASVPGLVVIIVLPIGPEEVDQPGGADPVTLEGMAEEHDMLDDLRTTLGGRIGLFSMVAHRKVTARSGKKKTNWASSPQVYVHSKLMIVDDVWATIGSANTSPRSLGVDTEANIHWQDPAGVRRMRLDLWSEMLGSPADLSTWAPADFVAKWKAIATANEASPDPRARAGFIVPHDPDKVPQGKHDPRVPALYTDLEDIDPDRDFLV